MSPLMSRIDTRLLAAGAVAVALVLGVVAALAGARATSEVTALFPQTVNLYPGDEVQVLGVAVGTVESVEPQGGHVAVRMSYDAAYPLPADATAAVVTPTLVGIRYVQLGPVYRDGPTLPDGGTIPIERTAVPLEWDDIRGELAALATELGPDRPGTVEGPLRAALETADANLAGNGAAVRTAIQDVSQLLTTLSNGREDLFGTVANLQKLVSTLRESDAAVAEFNGRLADVSAVLDDNGDALDEALTALDRASPIIEEFVADNRAQLAENIEGLRGVAATVAANRQGLADVLHRAPTAISSFYNIIDERSGAVMGGLATTNLRDPAALTCGAAAGVAPGGLDDPAATEFCRTALGSMLQAIRMDNLPAEVTPPPVTEDSGSELDRRSPGTGVGDLTELFLPGGTR